MNRLTDVMNIDWFTFTAQIFNFLLLVWLLKKFLYGPVIKAMDQREADIADRVRNLELEKTAAEQQQQDYQARIDTLEKTRDSLLGETQQEVRQWREEHLQQAKKEVESAREEWQQAFGREKESLIRDLQSEVYHQAIHTTECLITELSGSRLQSHIVERFADLLSETDSETAATLRSAHRTQNAVVDTSHELPDTEQQQIESAVRRLTGSDRPITFRTRPELVCGIELQISGHRLSWSGRNALTGIKSQLLASVDHLTSEPSEQTISPEDRMAGEVSAS